MTPLYEGKAKRMWATENPDTLRMEFKNDATAFNGEKKASFENKGRLNNAISTLIYGMLEKEGVPTHFVRQIDETNVEVKKVDILMVEVIVRNYSAGSFCKRTGMEEGRKFSQPIVEFSYKSDELGDPLINDDYIREMDLASPEDMAHLRKSALKVNAILSNDRFEMEPALIKQSGKSEAELRRTLFANMNAIDFDGDGETGEYGIGYVSLAPVGGVQQPFAFNTYDGKFRWYSFAIHGSNNDKRIGQKVTGGCVNVAEPVLKTLLSSVQLGDEVEVTANGPCLGPATWWWSGRRPAAWCFMAMLWIWKRTGKPDPAMMANGLLAGLVIITAPCAFLDPWVAALLGAFAGVVVIEAVFFIERRMKIDDPVGAIAVHGVCGTLGVIAVGLLANGKYGLDAGGSGIGWNGTTTSVTDGVADGVRVVS